MNIIDRTLGQRTKHKRIHDELFRTWLKCADGKGWETFCKSKSKILYNGHHCRKSHDKFVVKDTELSCSLHQTCWLRTALLFCEALCVVIHICNDLASHLQVRLGGHWTLKLVSSDMKYQYHLESYGKNEVKMNKNDQTVQLTVFSLYTFINFRGHNTLVSFFPHLLQPIYFYFTWSCQKRLTCGERSSPSVFFFSFLFLNPLLNCWPSW